jgi:hypothetical protein
VAPLGYVMWAKCGQTAAEMSGRCRSFMDGNCASDLQEC